MRMRLLFRLLGRLLFGDHFFRFLRMRADVRMYVLYVLSMLVECVFALNVSRLMLSKLHDE